MVLDEKTLIITDSATKPECHLTLSTNVIQEREGSFLKNPMEGAISRQEFEARSAALNRANELSL